MFFRSMASEKMSNRSKKVVTSASNDAFEVGHDPKKWCRRHMSRLSKAGQNIGCIVTQLTHSLDYRREENSASKYNQVLKIYIPIVNHHDQSPFEGELLRVISRREPSLGSWHSCGCRNVSRYINTVGFPTVMIPSKRG